MDIFEDDAIAITRVAKMLDEDEAWLQEIALEMEPEDGRLAVWGFTHAKSWPSRRRLPRRCF
jgi:hypothetical protein